MVQLTISIVKEDKSGLCAVSCQIEVKIKVVNCRNSIKAGYRQGILTFRAKKSHQSEIWVVVNME